MASSASGQDKSNPTLWLATRAGKMELSFPLGTTAFRKNNFHKSHILYPLLTKLVRPRWKMAGHWPPSFFASLWTSTESRSINKNKEELGQYPAILTSHLVNNPYLCTVWSWTSYLLFTITAEIHARSLANIYGQYADRHLNLKFMRRVSECESGQFDNLLS